MTDYDFHEAAVEFVTNIGCKLKEHQRRQYIEALEKKFKYFHAQGYIKAKGADFHD